jgi:glycosyltransferase involved in cell wall biosynthesis
MAWLLDKLWNRTGALTLRPIKDIYLADREHFAWQVTGPDPQFLLQSNQFPLAPGRYRLVASDGSDLNLLQEASFYIDFGDGFQESAHHQVHFVRHPSTGYFTELFFDRQIVGLRFDPAAGSLPVFGLKEFRLSRATNDRASSHFRALIERRQRRPKVLLNLFRLLPGDAGAGGAGRVCMALLAYLPEFVSLRVIISPHHQDLQREFPGINFVVTAGDAYHILAEHLAWCDCYFDPLNALRPTYIPQHIPVLGWLHDLQHMHLPWFFSDAELEFRFREYGYVAHRADRLIAISEFERENLERFYGSTKADVVYESGFLAESISQLGAPQRPQSSGGYFIYPAIPWVHKNHGVLLQALAVLHRRGVHISLLMTNARGPGEGAERLSNAVALLGIDHLVKFEGFLPEAELADRLLKSTGLVFPSLYEGFGIPLVDALKLGIPILASRSAAIPEICGDACSYFENARNALSVADDLEAFWKDDERRAHQRKAGPRQGARYSSRKMASEIGRIINDVVADSAKGRQPRARLSFVPPRRRRFAVFVIYEEGALGDVLSKGNIHRHHISLFGQDANITVGLDLRLAQNDRLAAIFKAAPNLIAFDGATMAGRDAAVYDFSTRYDDAEYHLVAKHPSCIEKYSPFDIDSMLTSLELYPRAELAVFDPNASDIILEGPPTETEGCLRYDTMRQTGFAVCDHLIRRAGALRGLSNGTAPFLSVIATRAELLRHPWPSASLHHSD